MLTFSAESILSWCGRRTKSVDLLPFIDDVVDIVFALATFPFPVSASPAAFCDTVFTDDVVVVVVTD